MVSGIDESHGEKARAVEGILGYEFTDKQLLIRALTREAYAKERRDEGDECEGQEALETLGDAILGAAVTDLLFRSGCETGHDISTRRDRLINDYHLAEVAKNSGIAPYIILNGGEEKGGRREEPSILADTLEALIGAVHVDGGFDAAKKVVEERFEIR
ncbi:MAG: dsRNA-specific ribonuclease [Candidatus Thermoplasmatota archaeon]|nr:dsRNA-specific ribonuclease [Candidatus Thermoplasmatota archaeon]